MRKKNRPPKDFKRPVYQKEFEYKGEVLDIYEIEKRTGVKAGTVTVRFNKLGWDIDKIMTTPTIT